MTAPIHRIGSTPTKEHSITLRIQLTKSISKIEKKLVAVNIQDDLKERVTEWKDKFKNDLRTNGDLNPIIADFSGQLVQILETYPLLKMPFQRLDARHHLVESLIYFIKAYDCVGVPEPLEAAYQKILEIKTTPQLTDEQNQAIQVIQARYVAANQSSHRARRRPPRLSPNIQTLQSIKERVEKETLENMKRIEELEQQLTTDNITAVLESLKKVEERNQRIETDAQQQLREVLRLEQQYNPFSVFEPTPDHVIQMPKGLLDTVLRRKLRVELIALKNTILKNQVNDLLEETLWGWGNDLWVKLERNGHEDVILQEHLIQLNQSLTKVFDTENRDISSHPMLQYVERWLQNFNAQSVLETIAQYKTKMGLGLIDRLNALRVERENEKNETIAQKRKRMQARIDERMPNILAPMDHVRKLNNEGADIIDEELNQMEVQDENSAKEQIAAINDIRERNLELDKRNVAIAKRLDNSQQTVAELANENLKLEMAKNEVKKALNKQRKGGLKTVLTTAAIVTACALATWGLGVTVAPNAAGASVVIPIPI